jgi:iron complex outermembrane receptor protein
MADRLKRQLTISVSVLGMLATPALAQDGAAAGGEGDAIIVTARRVEERLQDVPISITVFNQEAISNRNIVNSTDLATYTPSLSINATYGPEKATFAIRGFVQELSTQPSVGVYFADVVAPRSAGSLPSGNGVGVGNLFDLENVQVLKGPQGTLFGRNTTGGAVIIVPKKPTGDLEGYVEGSLGNYDMRRLQAVANLPLADTFKVRLGVDRMERDGYLKNLSGIGPKAFRDTDYLAARLSTVAELTPTLENYTIATYTHTDTNGNVPHVVGCNPGSAFAGLCNAQLVRDKRWWDIESNEPDPILKNVSWQVINTTTWSASDALTIKNIVSYAEARETARYQFLGENLAVNGVPLLILLRTLNTPNYHNSSQSTFTEELQFQGIGAGGSLTWQAGAYYEDSSPLGFTSQFTPILLNCPDAYGLAVADTLQCPASASGSISVPFQKTHFRDRGIYAQGTYDFSDKIALTAGIRYTWNEMTHRYDGVSVRFPTDTTSVYSCSNPVRVTNPDGSSPVIIGALGDHERCKVSFTAKSRKPTWLINLDYKPNSDLMFYAKWARGYRPGGAAAANILLETWKPETVDSYEIGAKTTFSTSGIRGFFNIAAFYNDFRDQQIKANLPRNPRPGNPAVAGFTIVNAGKSRIWGIEVDASATVLDNLRLDLGYSYLDTKVLAIDTPLLPVEAQPFYDSIVPTSAKGDSLALTPKNRVTATATYTLPIDQSIGRIAFGATFVHTDKQVASLATPPQFGILPATDLLNLNASWNGVLGAPVDLSFFMTNVTQEKFPLNVNSSYNSFGIESATVNEPRMWGFRLRYSFGG